MFTSDDTIVAIATPSGRGAIGVVRLSGPDAARIAAALTDRDRSFEPRHATLAIISGAGGTSDRVVVTYFPAPHSYTGEDVVEVSAHGSPVLLGSIVESSMREGARLAEPGEFTFRAYLRGRIDLVQAEAVRDLVAAVTPLQARSAFDQLEGTLTSRIRKIDRELFELAARLEASLDFPEEGYHFVQPEQAAENIRTVSRKLEALVMEAGRGRLIREGAQVVIVGRPNSGKSSVFNQLVGVGRAIVTEVPGTTRDLLTEVVDICGIPVTVVDTAGVRASAADAIEAEGIARATAAREVASASIVVLDRSRPLGNDDHALIDAAAQKPCVVVVNKIDLPEAWSPESLGHDVVCVCALSGAGMDGLRHAVAGALGSRDPLRDTPALTNMRHVNLVTRAAEALNRGAAAAAGGLPEEVVLVDVNDARSALEEITGARTPADVLNAIFSTFCIGK